MFEKKKVIMCVDFVASFAQTREEEYEDIKQQFTEVLFPDLELEFEQDVFPGDLPSKEFDIYVFDFGGILPGAEDMVRSHYRELIRQVRGREDKLFVLWSTFTERWYEEVCQEMFPEFIAPNVVYLMGHLEDYTKRCRTFFRLSEEAPPDHTKILKTPPQRPSIGGE